MVKSMTGFGRSSGVCRLGEVQIEVRGVNGKHLDMKIKTPRYLFALESFIQKEIRSRVERGRIECSLMINPAEGQAVELHLNPALAAAYLQAADELKSRFHLENGLTAEFLLRLPDVLSVDDPQIEPEIAWEEMRPILALALDAFCAMREREGEELNKELADRIRRLRMAIDAVDSHRQETIALHRDRLAARMNELLADMEVDQVRLMQEVAFLAERSDITEEVVRMRSHLDQFETMLHSNGSTGRQMDFLLQEMFREINTIGSKTEILAITQLVLEMKTEVDKLREQVQNIE